MTVKKNNKDERGVNEDLFDFLKKKNAYDAFMMNILSPECNGSWSIYPEKSLNKLILTNRRQLYDSFMWEKSIQGFEYWSNLEDEYMKIKYLPK